MPSDVSVGGSVASSGGAGLSDLQTSKLSALPVPLVYDDERPLTARSKSALSADVVLATDAGTDVSTTPHTLTLAGSASLDTTESWSGSSSLLFTGTDGDLYSAPQSTDFDFGAGEFDVRFAGFWTGSTPAEGHAIGKWDGSPLRGWQFGLRSSGGSTLLQFAYSTVGSDEVGVAIDISAEFTTDAWHHYRACRVGDTLKLYMDEKLMHTADLTGVTFATVSTPLKVGDNGDTVPTWDGNLDALFVQKAGTIEGDEYHVCRTPYTNAAGVVYQPERDVTPLTLKAFGPTTDVVTHASDLVFSYEVPAKLNGKRIYNVSARHDVVGSGGTASNVKINIGATAVLSTDLTIDSGELNSSTAVTAAVIDLAENTLATGDVLKFLLTAADTSTVPKGLDITVGLY